MCIGGNMIELKLSTVKHLIKGTNLEQEENLKAETVIFERYIKNPIIGVTSERLNKICRDVAKEITESDTANVIISVSDNSTIDNLELICILSKESKLPWGAYYSKSVLKKIKQLEPDFNKDDYMFINGTMKRYFRAKNYKYRYVTKTQLDKISTTNSNEKYFEDTDTSGTIMDGDIDMFWDRCNK